MSVLLATAAGAHTLATAVHARTHAAARAGVGSLFRGRGRERDAAFLRPLEHLFVMLGTNGGTFFVGTGRAHGIAVLVALLFGHQLAAKNRFGDRIGGKRAARSQQQAGSDEAEQ
jgi:hypothetical protein